MKVTKQEIQVVVTPPPTFTIEGLTEMDMAVLRAVSANRFAAIQAVAGANSFIKQNQDAARGTFARLRAAVDAADVPGVWKLKESFETNRDRGDETSKS